MKNAPASAQRLLRTVNDNIVTILVLAFTLVGFMVSSGVMVNVFLTELTERITRNAVLILSLIIPIVAGLGLNFGIIIGAMSAQLAVIVVRYHNIGGIPGLLLCVLIATPIAIVCGFLTGKLYNKTRGQEMIASLIVGFFADGVYQFICLFVIGAIIPVTANHPMINPHGIGIRNTVDFAPASEGGLKYVLDSMVQVPFVYMLLAVSLVLLAASVFLFLRGRKKPEGARPSPVGFGVNVALCAAGIIISLWSIATNSALMLVRKAPLATIIVIAIVCVFMWVIQRTKLGQDFRSVGQSQHIAEVAGINVNRTRIIATIFSTVLAAWGMIIYLQNMGTLNVYGAHQNIGIFSVAAILVGGASASYATIKHGIFGAVLFNAMFIISPEVGRAIFGNEAQLGEYFRSFMVYGVIGVALGLYVWKNAKENRLTLESLERR